MKTKPTSHRPVILVAAFLVAACEPGSDAPELFIDRKGTAPGVSLGDRLAAADDLQTAAALYAQEAQNAQNPLARARAFEKLGDVLLRADQPRRAIGAFREAVAARPDLASAEVGLGVAFIQSGEPDAALAPLLNASGRGEISAFSALGVAYDLLGRPAEAQAAYDTGLERAPGNLDLTTNKAISMALAGQFDAAYSTMRPAADSVFASPRHRRNLVLVVAMSGDTQRARREGQLMRLPPAEVSEVINLGIAVSASDGANRNDLLTSLTGR